MESKVRISVEKSCAACGASIVTYNTDESSMCSSCDGKVLVLTDTLVKAVRAELSSRLYSPKYFPNPYLKQGFGGIIDFTPFVARAKAS